MCFNYYSVFEMEYLICKFRVPSSIRGPKGVNGNLISLVNVITDFSCKTKTASYNIRADILRRTGRSATNLRITFARWTPISLGMAQRASGL